jgi:hypothetical protein
VIATATVEKRLAVLERLIDHIDTPAPPQWASPTALADDVGIDLDHWQRRVLASTSLRLIMKGPRQVGKSTVSGLLSLHTALTKPESLTLLIAPSNDQSKELARTVRQMASRLGLATMERTETIAPTLLSASRIEFASGSRVIALPGRSEASVRGYGAPDLIVCDEASRILEDTYAALRPMLVASPNGRLILLSTPYLKAGTFYRTWTGTSDSWERVEIATTDCPRLSPQFLAQEKAELPFWIYQREYEGLFSDDEQTLFSSALIEAALDPTLEPLFAEDDDATS